MRQNLLAKQYGSIGAKPPKKTLYLGIYIYLTLHRYNNTLIDHKE